MTTTAIYWKLEVDGETFDIRWEDIEESMRSGEWFHPLTGNRMYGGFMVRGRP